MTSLILTTITKILLLSIVISLVIKSSAALVTVQGTNTIATIIVLTPSVAMALWFWQQRRSDQP